MNTSRFLINRLRENELGKATGLSSGALNPWDLPEFKTARRNMLAEKDIGLSDYVNKLTRSGVEGPGAALALEKAGAGYGNNLLNLSNKLQGAYTDRGLSIGKDIINDRFKREELKQNWEELKQNWAKIGLAWKLGHDARRAQPNDFMKTLGAVKGTVGVLSDIADLGFGGAAMLGKLPGSILANKGMNITQIMDMLRSMGFNLPVPGLPVY